MTNREILDSIRNLPSSQKKNMDYDQLIELFDRLTEEEIIELSEIIGYPVFTRSCMGALKHKFILLQDGAAAIIVNEKGEILLQSRTDNDRWGLPGGCQELGERFEDVVIREVKEETNLDVLEEDLELISVVSGSTRKNKYPNGDIVFNNTVLYCINKYSGDLKWDNESKNMKFFSLDNLPENQNDPDLIKIYKKYINKN